MFGMQFRRCARTAYRKHAGDCGWPAGYIYLVRSALSAAVEDENVKGLGSERVKKMRDDGNSILYCVAKGDAEMAAFDTFSEDMLHILRTPVGQCASYCIKREKLWTRFHEACIMELPRLWTKLLSDIKVTINDDLFH